MNQPEQKPSETEPTLVERSLVGGSLGAGSVAAAGAPPLATIAAAAAGVLLPFAEIVAHRAFNEFRSDARARVNEMLASTDQELGGVGPEKLADLAGKSEKTRLLTAIAVDAAARTTWPPRVIGLGRVLASGLITDDARIDDEQLALSAMADMERSHVSLLELLVRWQPGQIAGGPDVERYNPMELGWQGEPLPWHAGDREWTVDRIIRARPTLAPVLTSLMGTLQRHGLTIQNANIAEAIERFSAILANDVNRRTRRGGGGMPTVPAEPRRLSIAPRDLPPATWSPTELGERVLGFYQLAADTTEFEVGPTGL